MKSEQRRIIRERLQNLTEKEKRSEVIARKLKKLLENDNCIAAFYPLANEPDITSLFDERFAFPEKLSKENLHLSRPMNSKLANIRSKNQ